MTGSDSRSPEGGAEENAGASGRCNFHGVPAPPPACEAAEGPQRPRWEQGQHSPSRGTSLLAEQGNFSCELTLPVSTW